MPLCDKEVTEREAAINAHPLTDVIGPFADHQAAASLKESVARETPDVAVAAAATTSGSRVPKTGRMFTSVLGSRQRASSPSAMDASSPPPRRRKLVTLGEKSAQARAAQDKSEGASGVSPAATSTDVVVAPKSREATPSSPSSALGPTRGPSANVLTWGELQAEMQRILEAGARGVSREIEEVKTAAASSANERADKLERDLAEVREDLQKMRELVAGNERQWRGLEDRMSELKNNLSGIRGSLRVTYTGLHQLAGECGITSTIPANPGEFSLTSSLVELATAMEAIPSKHMARIVEEASNGIYTGACHVLACVRLAHPELDLRQILDRGAANDTRKGVMEEGCRCRGCPAAWAAQVTGGRPGDYPSNAYVAGRYGTKLTRGNGHGDDLRRLVIFVFISFILLPGVTWFLCSRNGRADLESRLAGQDRCIQYWKTKCEVAELERAMVEVKKDQAVEALRGREVWFDSYLKSCCTGNPGRIYRAYHKPAWATTGLVV
uniref:Myosin heavy chain-like protein n=1 Tax=Oryza sativa subsp. japonica TaxID=39947 RepID=Q7EZ92_ORYSJ|nr:myosin heavy chain-like protein [Oryza sativa Japonica Group]BAD10081.1 myosin heavy chain-like protein [Oryza sativa Japonica Group]